MTRELPKGMLYYCRARDIKDRRELVELARGAGMNPYFKNRGLKEDLRRSSGFMYYRKENKYALWLVTKVHTRHGRREVISIEQMREKIEISKNIREINLMSHEEMCNLWRNAPQGHIYFDSKLPYSRVFSERLFKHFGGVTPEISKKLGWV